MPDIGITDISYAHIKDFVKVCITKAKSGIIDNILNGSVAFKCRY